MAAVSSSAALDESLRARIERPAAPGEAESATRAAEAVFAHFLTVAEQGQATVAPRESLSA